MYEKIQISALIDSILSQTVDFELYAQYEWKRLTNWKTSPPPPP